MNECPGLSLCEKQLLCEAFDKSVHKGVMTSTDRALMWLQDQERHQQPLCQRGLLVRFSTCSLSHVAFLVVHAALFIVPSCHDTTVQASACMSLRHADVAASAIAHARWMLCRYAEPTFEEEEEVMDGDFSGSMFGLIDNDEEPSNQAAKGPNGLDKALSKVRQELDKQLTRAGVNSGLTFEVDAALGQVSGLASRLFGSAEEAADPASA